MLVSSHCVWVVVSQIVLIRGKPYAGRLTAPARRSDRTVIAAALAAGRSGTLGLPDKHPMKTAG
jgi:hypothetical protein